MCFYSGYRHYVSQQQQQVLSTLPFPKVVIAGDCDRVNSYSNCILIAKSLRIFFKYIYWIDVEPIILKNQGHGLHYTAYKECWEIMKENINNGENKKDRYDLKKPYHRTTCILLLYYYVIVFVYRCWKTVFQSKSTH